MTKPNANVRPVLITVGVTVLGLVLIGGSILLFGDPGGAGKSPLVTEATPPDPLPTSDTGDGIPFGPYGLTTERQLWGGTFTSTVLRGDPSRLIEDLTASQAAGMRVALQLVGRRANYQNADGTFNLTMWKSRIDRFSGFDFEPFVANGTLTVHLLIDEPKSRSRYGTEVIPNDVLDEMARYSEQLWPYFPTTIRVAPTAIAEHAAGYKETWPGWEWQYLDAAWAQYSARKGPIDEYTAAEVIGAKTQRLGLIVGLNVLTGGDGSSEIEGPAGASDKWAMSANELRAYGDTLIEDSYGCAFMMWSYQFDRDTDYEYFTRSDISAAVDELSRQAATRPSATCDPHWAATS